MLTKYLTYFYRWCFCVDRQPGLGEPTAQDISPGDPAHTEPGGYPQPGGYRSPQPGGETRGSTTGRATGDIHGGLSEAGTCIQWSLQRQRFPQLRVQFSQMNWCSVLSCWSIMSWTVSLSISLLFYPYCTKYLSYITEINTILPFLIVIRHFFTIAAFFGKIPRSRDNFKDINRDWPDFSIEQ